MVHRDLKIGLILGLILVVGIVIKLATNPNLNPEAKMMQFEHSANSDSYGYDGLSSSDTNDSNNALQKYTSDDISKQTASSEQIEQENPSLNMTVGQDTVNRTAPPEKSKVVPENIPEKKPYETASIPNAPAIAGIDYSNFDYDNAEVIKAQRFHIVGKNETLSEISNYYYHSPNQWRKIVDANPEIQDPNRIKPGMKLIIPWE